ncbi:MAG: hypothetical protein AB7Y46_21140 [Armatimonadota bacterium]
MADPHELTRMTYWWPLVADLDVPMPRTRIITIDSELSRAWFVNMADGRPGIYAVPPWDADLRAAAEDIGYPCFLRTDLTSAKHAWGRTCYVSGTRELTGHVYALLEFHFNALGLPWPQALVVREYLSPCPGFLAFGGLPIGRERRYFVRDNSVECHHPYWPENAIRGASSVAWKTLLADANRETPTEVELLTGYAQAIGERLGGYWSVDFFCSAEPRWYFIDAAVGKLSWHPACEVARIDDDAVSPEG